MKMLTPLDSISGGCLAQMLCTVTTEEWVLDCAQVSVRRFAKPVGSYVSIFGVHQTCHNIYSLSIFRFFKCRNKDDLTI